MGAGPVVAIGPVLFLLLVVAPAAWLLIHAFRARRKVRRAGIDAAHPGCPTCLYQMRGWKDANCPECGTDVRESGVVIGPRTSKALKVIVAMWLTLLVSAIAGGLLVRTLTRESSRSISTDLTFGTLNQTKVASITTTARWRRFPPLDERVTTLVIGNAEQHGDTFAATGAMEAAENVSFRIETPDDVPTESRLEAALRSAFRFPEDSLYPAIAGQIAQQIRNDRVSADTPVAVAATPGPLSSTGGTFRATYRSASWSILATIAIACVATVGVMWLVIARHRPGVRPVEPGEWSRA